MCDPELKRCVCKPGHMDLNMDPMDGCEKEFKNMNCQFGGFDDHPVDTANDETGKRYCNPPNDMRPHYTDWFGFVFNPDTGCCDCMGSAVLQLGAHMGCDVFQSPTQCPDGMVAEPQANNEFQCVCENPHHIATETNECRCPDATSGDNCEPDNPCPDGQHQGEDGKCQCDAGNAYVDPSNGHCRCNDPDAHIDANGNCAHCPDGQYFHYDAGHCRCNDPFHHITSNGCQPCPDHSHADYDPTQCKCHVEDDAGNCRECHRVIETNCQFHEGNYGYIEGMLTLAQWECYEDGAVIDRMLQYEGHLYFKPQEPQTPTVFEGDMGFHVHQDGINPESTSGTCGDAGGHFMWPGQVHGPPDGNPQNGERHQGDLGNIQAIWNGATVNKFDRFTSLYMNDQQGYVGGKTIVIHAQKDDGTADANPGSRVGCCYIIPPTYCPEGQHSESGTCVCDMPGYETNSEGICVCPDGMNCGGDPECPPGTSFDDMMGHCLCDDNILTFNPQTTRCECQYPHIPQDNDPTVCKERCELRWTSMCDFASKDHKYSRGGVKGLVWLLQWQCPFRSGKDQWILQYVGEVEVAAGSENPSLKGFHVHQTGLPITDPPGQGTCSLAEGHFVEAADEVHGLNTMTPPQRHHGDIGNIQFMGTKSMVNIFETVTHIRKDSMTFPGFVAMRSLVLHQKTDDFQGATGNAGDRLGCCLISYPCPPGEFPTGDPINLECAPHDCTENMTFDDSLGHCVCVNNFYWDTDAEICVPNTTTDCTYPMSWDDYEQKCVCDQPHTWVPGTTSGGTTTEGTCRPCDLYLTAFCDFDHGYGEVSGVLKLLQWQCWDAAGSGYDVLQYKGHLGFTGPGPYNPLLGFHVHQNRVDFYSSPPGTCLDAGGHFQEMANEIHGNPINPIPARHHGDLGNIHQASKSSYVNIFDRITNLYGSMNGYVGDRTIVIHAKEDNLNPQGSSSSTGDAGARLGCCWISYPCPDGQHTDSTGNCVTSCPEGQHIDGDGTCVCDTPNYFVDENGDCQCTAGTDNCCPPHTHWNANIGRCMCNNNDQHWNENMQMCVCSNELMVLDTASGDCYCPAGTNCGGQCATGQYWDAAEQKCKCDHPYHWDDETESCTCPDDDIHNDNTDTGICETCELVLVSYCDFDHGRGYLTGMVKLLQWKCPWTPTHILQYTGTVEDFPVQFVSGSHGWHGFTVHQVGIDLADPNSQCDSALGHFQDTSSENHGHPSVYPPTRHYGDLGNIERHSNTAHVNIFDKPTTLHSNPDRNGLNTMDPGYVGGRTIVVHHVTDDHVNESSSGFDLGCCLIGHPCPPNQHMGPDGCSSTICPPGQHEEDGECKCDNDAYILDSSGDCVCPANTNCDNPCKDDQTWDGINCHCRQPFIMDSFGDCVCPVDTNCDNPCKDDQTWDGTDCHCKDPNLILDSFGDCVCPANTNCDNPCKEHQHWDGTDCHCNDLNLIVDNFGDCVCPAMTHWVQWDNTSGGNNGACECIDPNQYWQDGNCECRPPHRWNQDRTDCEVCTPTKIAHCDFTPPNGLGMVNGMVKLIQWHCPFDPVHFLQYVGRLDINFPAGLTVDDHGMHGFHVHHDTFDPTKADSSCHDCGGHMNTIPNEMHGGPSGVPGASAPMANRHHGDLGNVHRNGNMVHIDIVDPVTTLCLNDRWNPLSTVLDPGFVGGRSLVLHGGVDDLTTQPSGNAGDRIGCCRISMPCDMGYYLGNDGSCTQCPVDTHVDASGNCVCNDPTHTMDSNGVCKCFDCPGDCPTGTHYDNFGNCVCDDPRLVLDANHQCVCPDMTPNCQECPVGQEMDDDGMCQCIDPNEYWNEEEQKCRCRPPHRDIENGSGCNACKEVRVAFCDFSPPRGRYDHDMVDGMIRLVQWWSYVDFSR